MVGTLRLGAKLMAIMGLAVLAVSAVQTVAGLRSLEKVIDQAERAELEGHVKAAKDGIAAESRLAEGLATLVASLRPVQDLFAAGDRTGLTALLHPTFKTLAEKTGVAQFQFHTPPATSFLRLHILDKFGDDLSSFRATVVQANKTLASAKGLEGGVGGLGVRGVVPVLTDGRHIGSVEFGMSFGKAFFESLKTRRNVDFALYLPEGNRFVSFASTLDASWQPDQARIAAAFRGDGQLERTDLGGLPLVAYDVAVEDFSGKRIGVLELVMDRSRYAAELEDHRRIALGVGGTALVFGFALALAVSRHVTARLSQLAAGMGEIAVGNLTVDLSTAGRDEVGALGDAAAAMQAQLHAIVKDVRGNAHVVAEAAQQIANAVDGQAVSSSEMSASVAEITSTMEELTASSLQIAEHSKAVVEIAHQTWEQCKRGSESMEAMLSRMVDIQSENQNSLREILDLGKRSKEIGKVMEIINAVADQTKLIAFNAALEAAGAGEAGRRFSVVASEIRRLADSVTESTEEIKTKIDEIQDSVNRLVVTSEKGASGIAAGMDATTGAADRLGEMVGAARETAEAAQQISLSTQQQKTATTQVVVALREIVSASGHTAQSIARISEISREMAQLSTSLETLVGSFRLNREPTPAPLSGPAAVA